MYGGVRRFFFAGPSLCCLLHTAPHPVAHAPCGMRHAAARPDAALPNQFQAPRAWLAPTARFGRHVSSYLLLESFYLLITIALFLLVCSPGSSSCVVTALFPDNQRRRDRECPRLSRSATRSPTESTCPPNQDFSRVDSLCSGNLGRI
jgi:hypothetical protein